MERPPLQGPGLGERGSTGGEGTRGCEFQSFRTLPYIAWPSFWTSELQPRGAAESTTTCPRLLLPGHSGPASLGGEEARRRGGEGTRGDSRPGANSRAIRAAVEVQRCRGAEVQREKQRHSPAGGRDGGRGKSWRGGRAAEGCFWSGDGGDGNAQCISERAEFVRALWGVRQARPSHQLAMAEASPQRPQRRPAVSRLAGYSMAAWGLLRTAGARLRRRPPSCRCRCAL